MIETTTTRRIVNGRESVTTVTRELKPSEPRKGDCAELGQILPNQNGEPCGRKLRKCAIHGTCTGSIKVEGVACCRTCPDNTTL